MLVVFNQYFLATGMTHKFRRIVALNGGNSARISTGIIHPQFVFEYISSFWQISEEELSEIIGCHRNSVVRAVHDLSCYGIVEPMKTLSIKNRLKYTYRVLNEDDLINKWAQQEIENLMDKVL
jgi:hypothetical protein